MVEDTSLALVIHPPIGKLIIKLSPIDIVFALSSLEAQLKLSVSTVFSKLSVILGVVSVAAQVVSSTVPLDITVVVGDLVQLCTRKTKLQPNKNVKINFIILNRYKIFII